MVNKIVINKSWEIWLIFESLLNCAYILNVDGPLLLLYTTVFEILSKFDFWEKQSFSFFQTIEKIGTSLKSETK